VSARRGISRRWFVALAGAGLAAAVTTGAAPATPKKKPAAAAAKPEAAASGTQKEFDRQKASTLAALKTIRDHALPPGGDLPVVFRPLRAPKKGR
jgi:hypothetical protein